VPDRPPRPQPQRTCVACRSTGDKRGLLRVVRTPDGSVEVDQTGKRAGRGAYLCSKPECWREAIKKGRLDAALKVSLSPDAKLRLVEFATNVKPAPSTGLRTGPSTGPGQAVPA
jgi:predicted RNA-binding protein YlxR (DUF448 family)